MRFFQCALGALLSSLVCSSARAEDPPKTVTPPMSKQEADLAAWKTLMSSASGIDACVESYASEYPTANGTARVDAAVSKDGSVSRANVSTSLEGARNLRPCLEKVAKGWKFPAHDAESQPLSLTVPVRKGAKFKLKKPGEKEEPPKPGEPPGEEAAFNFNFLPGTWTEQK